MSATPKSAAAAAPAVAAAPVGNGKKSMAPKAPVSKLGGMSPRSQNTTQTGAGVVGGGETVGSPLATFSPRRASAAILNKKGNAPSSVGAEKGTEKKGPKWFGGKGKHNAQKVEADVVEVTAGARDAAPAEDEWIAREKLSEMKLRPQSPRQPPSQAESAATGAGAAVAENKAANQVEEEYGFGVAEFMAARGESTTSSQGPCSILGGPKFADLGKPQQIRLPAEKEDEPQPSFAAATRSPSSIRAERGVLTPRS